MKHYSLGTATHSLKEFGFIYLTGEACAYNMRGKFDMNEEKADYPKRMVGNQ